MSNSRAENFFGLLATTLRFGLTVLTALILTLQANGYIIDFKNFTLEKSSLIAIKFDDLPDLVQVDNQPLVVERNQVIEQINPGQHDLIFSKEGYYDWYNSFRVEPGQAEHYEDVKLFLQEPILVNRQSVTAPPLPQASPDILVLGSELWLRLPDQLKLITRYSQSIKQAQVFDTDYVIVVVDNLIRVISIDGSNDTVIFKMDNLKGIKVVNDKQISLVFADKIETYKIR